MDDQNKTQNNGEAQEVSELDKVKQEKDEYLNGWKRAKADLINYQKDEGKRFEEMMKYSTEAIVRDLIPVLDSMELALSMGALAKADISAQKGFSIIRNQLEEVLKKKGLEKLKVSPGDNFDPAKHESIGEVDEGSPLDSGKIAEEIESGYLLNGKVVRPARVKLSK